MTNRDLFKQHFQRKVGLLDGAMGTMIQGYELPEQAVLGDRFKNRPNLKSLPDILCLTVPEIITEIHAQYLKAGSCILRTNTFGASLIGAKEYWLSEKELEEINIASVSCAKKARDNHHLSDGILIAGSVGPTNKQSSISTDVNNPTFREVDFEEMVRSYYTQISALVKGGVDILFPETSIDTLNLKACLFAVEQYCKKHGKDIPVMASVSVDPSGRTVISGQNIEALWTSIEHMQHRLLSIGINCSLGPDQISSFISRLSNISPILTSCHPNAGLPNAIGRYDMEAEEFASSIEQIIKHGNVNIVGGCCGTTPKHIEQIRRQVQLLQPRTIGERKSYFHLSGTDYFKAKTGFIKVGERANVMGSLKFRKLIREGNYGEALEIVRNQIELGADIIDINMDADLIDAKDAIVHFIRLIANDPDLSRVPIMIDSSDWEVIEVGLQNVQGKCVVNSISLKNGEENFKNYARKIREYGASVLVIASDEKGQATSSERKFEICKRAYTILTKEIGFPAEDIIFDPNVLTIGTGGEEHVNYGVEFIKAVQQIKKECPGSNISGGISNISFAFKGNDNLRISINTVFLHHAINAGLNMGIVNVAQLRSYEDIDEKLRTLIEDLIFNRNSNATECLIEYAENNKIGLTASSEQIKKGNLEWRNFSLDERLAHALRYGINTFLISDLDEAMIAYKNPYDIISGPLIGGMQIVGDLFQKGEMFLAQVLRSAKIMSEASGYLEKFFEKDNNKLLLSKRTIVLATVKGDQHDIGKNIVKIILECNGFQIIDLGIDVEYTEIIRKVIEVKASLIGVSGLIVPSLHEIEKLAKEIEKQGLNIPLLVGGATTSQAHAAVVLSKVNSQVFHAKDATEAVVIAQKLSDVNNSDFIESYRERLLRLSIQYEQQKSKLISYEEARQRGLKTNWREIQISHPNFVGRKEFIGFPIKDLLEYINWTPLFASLKLKGKYPEILNNPSYGEEVKKIFNDVQLLLTEIINNNSLSVNGVYGFWNANSIGDDIAIFDSESKRNELARFYTLRQQEVSRKSEILIALSDFVAPVESEQNDYIGGFAVGVLGTDEISGQYEEKGDNYSAILVKLIADRLAEAFAEKLHKQSRIDLGIEQEGDFDLDGLLTEKYRGIRPAFGYPSLPDYSEIQTLFRLLEAGNIGLSLTGSNQMSPVSSCSGLIFANQHAGYFNVGNIGKDQIEEYAKRKGISPKEAEGLLIKNLA